MCGRVGNPQKSGKESKSRKKGQEEEEDEEEERVFPAHTHVCDDDQQSCCCLREGGWFRQRNATKPQNLMTENSCSLFYFLALAIRRFPLFLIGLV